MASSVSIQVEGLRETAQALREIDRAAFNELKKDLGEVGGVIERDAARRFDAIDARSAAGFETRVRVNSSSLPLVAVGQKLLKTTGKRPDFGALQVKYLYQSRDAKFDEAVDILERGAFRLLKDHGF